MKGESAGAFGDWLAQILKVLRDPTQSMDVACGSCTTCCESSLFIHVEANEPARSAIPQELIFPAPGSDGRRWVMGYNEHGRCPMLDIRDRPATCTIYAARPNTCRTFDCRVFTATGVRPEQQALAERAEDWRFEFAAEEDARLQQAVKDAAQYLRDQDLAPHNATQHALAALVLHDLFLHPAKEDLLSHVQHRLAQL